MKDNFSSDSSNYSKFRPTYPKEFFVYLNDILQNKNRAWDCGTGNGQIAIELSKTFQQIEATDISETQINNAHKASNIHYSIQAAEKVNFKDNHFDLIIIGQAVHWFDFEKFYSEVIRTAKKDAIICVVGYGLLKTSPNIDGLIHHFYTNVIGSYWDDERKYIDENYQTIPFPFNEISTPYFSQEYEWDLEQLVGYINTWSAVKHFIDKNNFNPVEKLKSELSEIVDVEKIKIQFPMLLRMGYIHL